MDATVENELIAAAQAGDIGARNQLIVSHLDFIKREVKRGVGRWADPDDFLSFGVEIFIARIRSFRSDAGAKLSTYAAMSIAGDVRRESRRQSGPIDVPRIGVTASDATKEAALRARRVMSVDAPRSHDDERGFDLEDTREDDSGLDFDERERLESAIAGLPDRAHRAIIRGRLENKTLKEIADEVGLSESRLCQLQPLAVAAVQAAMRRGPTRIVRVRRVVRFWDGKELAILKREHEAGTRLAKIAAMLDRPMTSVLRWSRDLGLRRQPVWSPTEDAMLHQNSALGLRRCAELIGRPLNGVRSRAYDIGIRYRRSAAKEWGLIRSKHDGGLSIIEISRATGFDRTTVAKALRDRGLIPNRMSQARRVAKQREGLAAKGVGSVQEVAEKSRRTALGVEHLPSGVTLAYIALEAIGRSATAYEVGDMAKRMDWAWFPFKTRVFGWNCLLQHLRWLALNTPHVQLGKAPTGHGRPKSLFRVGQPLPHARPLEVPGAARAA